jgi:hypothetical protein
MICSIKVNIINTIKTYNDFKKSNYYISYSNQHIIYPTLHESIKLLYFLFTYLSKLHVLSKLLNIYQFNSFMGTMLQVRIIWNSFYRYHLDILAYLQYKIYAYIIDNHQYIMDM